MNKFLVYTTFISLVISLPTSAYADTDNPSLLGAIVSYAQAETKNTATRLTAAEDLLAATRAFSTEFPTLTPREEDYVEREMSEGSSDRLKRLINSDEYAIYKIREAVDGVERTLKEIIARGEAADSTRLKEWALVAFYLHDVNPSRFGTLVTNGTVQHHTFPHTANSAAQWILRHAVVQFPK